MLVLLDRYSVWEHNKLFNGISYHTKRSIVEKDMSDELELYGGSNDIYVLKNFLDSTYNGMAYSQIRSFPVIKNVQNTIINGGEEMINFKHINFIQYKNDEPIILYIGNSENQCNRYMLPMLTYISNIININILKE